jgi:hypothetical protein
VRWSIAVERGIRRLEPLAIESALGWPGWSSETSFAGAGVTDALAGLIPDDAAGMTTAH